MGRNYIPNVVPKRINSSLDLIYEAEQLAYDGDMVGFEAILSRLSEKQLNALISILVK